MRRVLILILGLFLMGNVFAAGSPCIQKVGEDVIKAAETPHPVPLGAKDAAVWRDVFTYKDATYIAVHFSRFELAAGEWVTVSSPDGKFSYTFKGKGKDPSGTFWATHIPGDTAIVTYHANGDGKGWGYAVDRFARGYPAEHWARPGAIEGICGADDSINAICYQGSEPDVYNNSKAVARLLSGGSALCTAWLVGCDGHVMTNNHCLASQTDVNNADFEFMAEGATCATDCTTSPYCPGTIWEPATPGTFVRTNYNADYTLIQLPANGSSQKASDVYGFLRLRTTPPQIDERIYSTQHPAGWGKRVALLSDAASDQSGFCEIATLDYAQCQGTGGPLDISYYVDTQGGSSGSPVFSYADQRVVAIHHCNAGGGACPNRGVPMDYIVADMQAAGQLPACATQQFAGTVDFDATSYVCDDIVSIKVKDDNLIGQLSQNVTIVSTTEATPETVTLVPLPAPNDNTFVGSIPLTTAPPVGGDNQLSVANGDTITVTYIDADDGQGGLNIPRNDTAVIDCVSPVITNVGATNVTGSSAVINWTTNEGATSIVRYGLLLPPGTTISNGALVTSHSMSLTGLDECSVYSYEVASQDDAGNYVADNNAGAYYTFQTSKNVAPSYPYTGPPVTIADNATVTAPITVTDTRVVQDVNVKVASLTHTYDGDLTLTLIAPNGTRVALSTRRGTGGDNFTDTVFDDEATTPISAGAAPFTGSFKPEALLSGLDGIPANGNWTLEVQDAASGDTGTLTSWEVQFEFPPEQCPTVGSVSLDKDTYTCAETVQIQVVDFSILGAGTQPVTIVSTTEAGGETVVLNETPANSARFIGTIPLTTAAPAGGDSLLSIASGDTITVTYIDADDGYGNYNVPRTDTATVDCLGPVITNVQAQNVFADAADITFDTNEPGNTLVYYGTTVPPTTPLSNAAFVTSHSTHLTGLAACTTYYFYVVSADPVGNSTTNDNSGAYYSFASDCTGPVISNVHTANPVGNSLDVVFDTNEPGNTTVYWGTTIPPTTPLSNAAFVTSHTTTLTGIVGCTTYYFYVASADPVGNSTTDNNGGAYYSFASDCSAPVITNVHTANLTGNSVDIVFDTNEPGNSTAYYGTTTPPATPASNAAFVTSHTLHVTGLTPCTVYYYYVASADPYGNATTNNNGGAYFVFTTPTNNNPTYSYSGPAVSIPDNNPAGASLTINVADVQQIQDLNVRVNITHSFDGDLVLSLIGPDSTTIQLSNRRGSSGDNFTNTVFDDAATTAISAGVAPFTGSFIPEAPLSAYNGKLAPGAWTLKVVDAAGADTGNVTGFDLFFTYPPQPCGQAVVHRISHSVTDACSAGGPGNADAIVDPGETLTIPVQLLNTGTATATGITATLSSTDPNVTFPHGTASYATLAIGQSAFGDQPFLVDVGAGIACGTVVPILITTTANEGSWTDTISLRVGAPVFNSQTLPSTDVPKTIADNAVVTSSLVVTDPGIVGDVNVQVSLTHTWDGDVTLTLIGPNAQRVTLVNRRGSSGDNFTGTIFDDQAATPITSGTPPYAGSFRPEQPLSALNGITANGTWKLEVSDQASGDTGTLTAWSLQLTTPGGYSCNACSIAPPGEATQLLFTAKDAVSWSAAPGASSYHVYRGAAGDLPKLLDASVDSCEKGSTASLSLAGLSDVPGVSSFDWYLVRGGNGGGLGSAGNATAGPRVHDSSGMCP